MSIRIGILGYGNLGRGVECAVKQNPDMELVAVFTRRNPENVTILTESAAVCSVEEAAAWKDKIDVLILCGAALRICRSRHQSLQNCSMLWIVLIHMPESRSILQMWMLQRRRAVRLELFL